MQLFQQLKAWSAPILAAFSLSSETKAAEIPLTYQKEIDGKLVQFEASELGLNGKPILHNIDFTHAVPEGRTGGSYISGGKPSTSGLMIESDCPIAILSAAQKVEIDFFGSAESPNDFTTYNYKVSNDKESLISQRCSNVSIPGSDLSWEVDSGNFTIAFDFYNSPIISDGTNTFCVPAASISQTSDLVPRNIYNKEPSLSGVKGFVWAENALNNFEWLPERSLRDDPTLPAINYPSQAVSYVKLRKVEQPKWSDNASKVGIKIEGETIVLQFSDEPFDRTVEATQDFNEWTEVYTLPAHETNIITTPYAAQKFFRVGPL